MSSAPDVREQKAVEMACTLGLNRPTFQLGLELRLAG